MKYKTSKSHRMSDEYFNMDERWNESDAFLNVGDVKSVKRNLQSRRISNVRTVTTSKEEKESLFCEELCIPQLIILGSDLFSSHEIEILIGVATVMSTAGSIKAKMIATGDVIAMIRRRCQNELIEKLDDLTKNDFIRFITTNVKGSEHTIVSFVKKHFNKSEILVITRSKVLLIQLEQSEVKVRTASPSEGGALKFIRANSTEKSIDIKSAIECNLSNEPVERLGKRLKTGCCVRHEDGTIYKLGEVVGNSNTSGEGKVYTVSDKLCVKIFHKRTSTPYRYEKVRKLSLLAKKISEKRPDLSERIAFPLGLVYNSRGEPVGYLQKRFTDVNELSVLNPINGIHLSRIERIKLAISLSELTCFLNEEGIMLSDVLSYQNIMFDSKLNAYMVDIDSVQFVYSGTIFRSTVGRDDYISPEHIGRKVYDYIRSPKDDSWALATILFYILFMTKPYARVNCNSLYEDTIAGRYSFPDGSGRCRSDIVEGKDGVYYKLITSYSSNLVQDMYDTFSSNGSHFREKDRFDCMRWLKNCVSELNIA